MSINIRILELEVDKAALILALEGLLAVTRVDDNSAHAVAKAEYILKRAKS